MSNTKKELAVAALRNGTVIDRIPSSSLFQAVRLLGLEKSQQHVTIGNNLKSGKIGTKGIIKIAETEIPEATLNRIALIAPTAVVNTIREFEVVDKREVELPQVLTGIVKCSNPKCISNNEPMATKFEVVDRNNITIKCRYCNHTVSGKDAQIL